MKAMGHVHSRSSQIARRTSHRGCRPELNVTVRSSEKRVDAEEKYRRSERVRKAALAFCVRAEAAGLLIAF